jgi:hypothetical protein
MFSLRKCLDASESGRWYLECKYAMSSVRVDLLAPEVEYHDFEGVRIQYGDLKMKETLHSTNSQVTVARAKLGGEMVVVTSLESKKLPSVQLKALEAYCMDAWRMSSFHHDNLVQFYGFCSIPKLCMVTEHFQVRFGIET